MLFWNVHGFLKWLSFQYASGFGRGKIRFLILYFQHVDGFGGLAQSEPSSAIQVISSHQIRRAALALRQPAMFMPIRHSFMFGSSHDNFCVIGRHRHGAFYILLKCAREMTSIQAGVRIGCFTLYEVGKYDIGIGGPPQICIIRPGQPVQDKSDDLEAEMKWVAEMSDKIRELITSNEPF